MDSLTDMIKEEIRFFEGDGTGAKLRTYSLFDDEQRRYGLVLVRDPRPPLTAMIVVFMLRIVGETVVIEEDSAENEMLRALLYRGIPREQIICTFLGETVPDEISIS